MNTYPKLFVVLFFSLLTSCAFVTEVLKQVEIEFKLEDGDSSIKVTKPAEQNEKKLPEDKK